MGWREGYRPLDGAQATRDVNPELKERWGPPELKERLGAEPTPESHHAAAVFAARFLVGLLVFFPATFGCYTAGALIAGPVLGVIALAAWLVSTLLIIDMVHKWLS